MHIPDGFLSTPVWGTLDVVSAPAVAWVARRAHRDTQDHRIPLLGVMGAFVFAAQMVNFPVGPGTSGHLVGGALLTIVLGPAAASLVLTAILVLQALIFQDGGVLALGANIFNMALVGVASAYLAHRLWGNIAAFEEQTAMQYVTSVERIGIEKGRREGWQEGRQEGEAALLVRLLERRFGDLPDWVRDRVRSADCALLETWSVRLLEAASVEEVLR